jgi:hypothetical protein
MGNWRRVIGLMVLCVGVLVPAAAASAASQYVALGDICETPKPRILEPDFRGS